MVRVEESSNPGIEFEIGAWLRSLTVGDADQPVYGLTEYIDNNPMVCADTMSLPSPAVALALIALCPLIESGLLAEAPVAIFSLPVDEDELQLALRQAGWDAGVSCAVESLDIGSAAAVTVMAAIRTPDDISEIDELFEERYGRSLYIRCGKASEWDHHLVTNTPRAFYQLSLGQDHPHSLLTVRVMADQPGKLGESAMIHAMNVMAGFEESLGIPE